MQSKKDDVFLLPSFKILVIILPVYIILLFIEKQKSGNIMLPFYKIKTIFLKNTTKYNNIFYNIQKNVAID